MSMIEKISNELGLELKQEFTIHEHKYKFTEDGLFWYDTCRQDWFLENDTLRSLIVGKLNRDLIKTNWKPKYGETYYYPCINSTDYHTNSFTYDDVVDNYYFTNNLMCKTKEEAEELYDYIIEKVKDYKEYKNNDI